MIDRKTMKLRFRVLAKVLCGIAGVVFICPASFFSTSFAPGILVQIAVAGVLGLVALVCWHLRDASGQERNEDRS